MRSAFKGQVLVEFIAKMLDMPKDDISESLWILETNGSSKAVGGGVGMVLQSLEGFPITQIVKFSFAILNSEAKYEAVLLSLQVAKELFV